MSFFTNQKYKSLDYQFEKKRRNVENDMSRRCSERANEFYRKIAKGVDFRHFTLKEHLNYYNG